MENNFSLPQGIEINDISGIHNCFEATQKNILASISSDKLFKILLELVKQLTAPVFFFIETPCDEETEKKLRKDDSSPLHKDIYYLDNCTTKVALAIIKRYGELLVNDGLVQFGFGSNTENEEIYIMKYNVLSIYAEDTSSFCNILKNYNITQENNIKTLWDILSEDNPGACTLIDLNGENIFDIVENLKDEGIYLSHQDEDN